MCGTLTNEFSFTVHINYILPISVLRLPRTQLASIRKRNISGKKIVWDYYGGGFCIYIIVIAVCWLRWCIYYVFSLGEHHSLKRWKSNAWKALCAASNWTWISTGTQIIVCTNKSHFQQSSSNFRVHRKKKIKRQTRF